MTPILIGAFLAGIFAGLLVVRARYGALRLSELPALFWATLAGREYRHQLRAVLARREQRQAALVQPPPRPRPSSAGPSVVTVRTPTCDCGMRGLSWLEDDYPGAVRLSHCPWCERIKRDYSRDDEALIHSGGIVSANAHITLPGGETITGIEWARRGGRSS